MTPQVAVVVSGFPRRSETFAVNELLGLADRGMLAGIFATKQGDDGEQQPGCERLAPLLDVLPGAGATEQGAALASRLGRRHISGIHAYFAHTPATVAEEAAARLAVRFGFSVHAKDARKVETSTLADRANRAACVVACNHDVARDLHDAGARVHLVPHGVDLDRFNAGPPPARTGLRLLAVGRLVAKKGFDVLIDALSQTEPTSTLRIIGDGPERGRLMTRIAALDLGGRVDLVGARTHATLPAEYAAADVVVVPSVVDASGDRDGLPNVVLEAMASGRPVVGTRVGAIEAAVKHGVTGLLIAPRSPGAIAAAVHLLADDVHLRMALGRRARAEATHHYDLARCVDRFARLIEAAYG